MVISNPLRTGSQICIVACCLWGCGPSEPVLQRLPVSGQVTAGANTELNGAIRFLPDEGNSGPVASTSITKGEYRFDTSNGPIAGKYRIEIVPLAEGKGSRKLPAAGGPTPDSAASNSAAKNGDGHPLTATVSADDTSFDFDLK